MVVGIWKSILIRKYLHLVSVAIDSEDILKKVSQPIVWSVHLENLCFKVYLAQTLDPAPLSGHPIPPQRGRAKLYGQGVKWDWDLESSSDTHVHICRYVLERLSTRCSRSLCFSAWASRSRRSISSIFAILDMLALKGKGKLENQMSLIWWKHWLYYVTLKEEILVKNL